MNNWKSVPICPITSEFIWLLTLLQNKFFLNSGTFEKIGLLFFGHHTYSKTGPQEPGWNMSMPMSKMQLLLVCPGLRSFRAPLRSPRNLSVLGGYSS